MKKKYEQPNLEVTEFRFSEHIAASGDCLKVWSNIGASSCVTGTPELISINK